MSMWMFVPQQPPPASSLQQATEAGNSAIWDAMAAWAAILGVVVAIAGVWLILRQIAENRRQMRGQLISDLENQFHNHFEIYQRFAPSSPSSIYAAKPLANDEMPKVCAYLSFFEKLCLLLNEGMIDMEQVDKLFAYRFFRVVNDPHVQNQVLYDTELSSYFVSIFDLYRTWEQHRHRNKLGVPFGDTSLDLKMLSKKHDTSDLGEPCAHNPGAAQGG